MRVRLLWKILLINVPVVATGIVVIWLAIDYLAANYFMDLMENYNISPTDAHRMFVDSIHRYLIGACVAAIFIAGALNFLLTKRVLSPLNAIIDTIKAMSSGSGPAQVRTSSNDELGDLATAFNQMAENIRKLEDLRRNMLIDVAHELRTPLTNIRGYVEGIRDGVVRPEEGTLALIQAEVLRLAALVEDVLGLARADAAEVDLEKQDVVLAELIKEAISRRESDFLDKGIVVKSRIEDGIDAVRADREKLTWIFTNLLQNAWQYTRRGGSVTVCANRGPEEIKVRVTNTGASIPRKDLSLIFERFYRGGDRSRSRKDGGAGVGLAIVKRLVEAHDGRVGAESANNTTTIWFTLPT